MEKKNVLEGKQLKEVILIGQTSKLMQTPYEVNAGTVNIEDESNNETSSKSQAQQANQGAANVVDEAIKKTSTDQSLEQQLTTSVNKNGKVKPKVIYPSNWSYPANLHESIRKQNDPKETDSISINIEGLLQAIAQVQELPQSSLSPSAKPSLNIFKQIKMQFDNKRTTKCLSECNSPSEQASAISIRKGHKSCKEIPTETILEDEEAIVNPKCICLNCTTYTLKCAENNSFTCARASHQQIAKYLSEVIELVSDDSIADTTNKALNTLEMISLKANCSAHRFPLTGLRKADVLNSLEDIAKQIRQEKHSTPEGSIPLRRALNGVVSFVRGIFGKTGSLINENFSFILFVIFFGWFLYVIFGYLAKIPNLKYYRA